MYERAFAECDDEQCVLECSAVKHQHSERNIRFRNIKLAVLGQIQAYHYALRLIPHAAKEAKSSAFASNLISQMQNGFANLSQRQIVSFGQAFHLLYT